MKQAPFFFFDVFLLVSAETHTPNAPMAETHTLSWADAIQQVRIKKESVLQTQCVHEVFKCACYSAIMVKMKKKRIFAVRYIYYVAILHYFDLNKTWNSDI